MPRRSAAARTGLMADDAADDVAARPIFSSLRAIRPRLPAARGDRPAIWLAAETISLAVRDGADGCSVRRCAGGGSADPPQSGGDTSSKPGWTPPSRRKAPDSRPLFAWTGAIRRRHPPHVGVGAGTDGLRGTAIGGPRVHRRISDPPEQRESLFSRSAAQGPSPDQPGPS